MQLVPDKWVVLKIGDDIYKVFASWYGGYAGTDEWKVNSGITAVTEYAEFFHFHGASGSIYSCNKESYGMTGYASSVLMSLKEHASYGIEVLPFTNDWSFTCQQIEAS